MTSNKNSSEVRKAKAEYMRSWRAKNKEKVKEIDNRYWENKSKGVNNE